MKNLFLKSLIIIISILILVNCFSVISLADGNFDLSTYDGSPDATQAGYVVDPARNIIGVIVSAVRITGVGVAVAMLTVLGIKYIVSAPGDRAEIKKSLVQYLAGAIIVLGSSQILALIIKVFPTFISK